MSISQQLVRLVFANTEDVYYRESLLALDFRRQLWFRLHEDGYETVYFLNWNASTAAFEISGMGEQGEVLFFKKLFVFGGMAKQQCTWIRERLQEETAAIVISMQDFHNAFEREEWKEQAEKLAQYASPMEHKGNLIITMPPYVEESHDFLLQDTALEKLSESIRVLKKRSKSRLYHDLKRDTGLQCLFFHEYTTERIRWIFARIALDQDEFLDKRLLHGMAEYVMFYLHSPMMQAQNPLRCEHRLRSNALYKETFQFFSSPKIWNALKTETQRRMQLALPLREQLEQEFGTPENQTEYIPIYTYHMDMRCFRSDITEQICRHLPEQMDALYKIRNELCNPLNRPRNAEILKRLREIDNNLDQIHSKYDYEVMKYRMKAMEFCVQGLYAEQEEAENVYKVLDSFENCCIALAEETAQMKQQYDHMLCMESSLMKKQREQLHILIDTSEIRLKKYDELISETIVSMTLMKSMEASTRLLENADDQIQLIEAEQPELIEEIPELMEELPEEEEIIPEHYEHPEDVPEWMFQI